MAVKESNSVFRGKAQHQPQMSTSELSYIDYTSVLYYLESARKFKSFLIKMIWPINLLSRSIWLTSYRKMLNCLVQSRAQSLQTKWRNLHNLGQKISIQLDGHTKRQLMSIMMRMGRGLRSENSISLLYRYLSQWVVPWSSSQKLKIGLGKYFRKLLDRLLWMVEISITKMESLSLYLSHQSSDLRVSPSMQVYSGRSLISINMLLRMYKSN